MTSTHPDLVAFPGRLSPQPVSCGRAVSTARTRFLALLGVLGGLLQGAAAQVWINEVLSNAPGSDTGNEYFELRGTPNLPLDGYYLLSLEGAGTTGRGDINQFFDLRGVALGANGYLLAVQAASPYSPADAGAALLANTVATGWGRANEGGVGSSAGHYSDGTQVDIENGTTTVLLIQIGSGVAPTNTLDLDPNDDGLLELPEGWTMVDSVGIMDGADAAATVYSYAAITFRAPDPNGNYLGTSAYGPIIDIPGPLTTTAGTFHVGRKGESTGSTAADWVGSIVDGAAASPLNFYFYSSSDPSYTGMRVSDMVYGGLNASPAPLGSLAYTPTLHGTRFTNYTHLPIGGPIGDVAVDPRDNTTIFFTVDNDVGGGIYRAYKVASGNWWVDSTPVVAGLDRPAGLVVQADGTLWWVHDVTRALVRLKAPWAQNLPEVVVSDFGEGTTDDDPIDLAFAPAAFTGTVGRPGWIVVADRGSDSDAFNALNLVDPATAELNQQNITFLVAPTSGGLGFDDLTAIDALPASSEVIVLSRSSLSAVDANGTTRAVFPTTLVLGAALGLAVDPTTGRVWVADDGLDEVWSVDARASGQTPDAKELSFPLNDPPVTYRQIRFHDPGLAFAPNGDFLVLSDTSTAGGGGRLIIFHREEVAPYTLPPFAMTRVVPVPEGWRLEWAAAGDPSFNLKYSVQRSSQIADPTDFTTIAADLKATTFTDTNAPPQGAFYRVVARP